MRITEIIIRQLEKPQENKYDFIALKDILNVFSSMKEESSLFIHSETKGILFNRRHCMSRDDSHITSQRIFIVTEETKIN